MTPTDESSGSSVGHHIESVALSKNPGRTPVVSIVTVVYNGAATLERTIQSVLAQDYELIEYIIVDGGSTDGTLSIVENYSDRIARWVSEPDRGIYDAMNKGIKMCTGDLVALINADDWYEPGVISRMVEESLAFPEVPIFHGDIWVVYGPGQRKMKYAKHSGFLLKYWGMVFNHPSFFVRKWYYETHLFSTQLPVVSDHHWTIRAFVEDERNFHYIPLAVANFSVGGNSSGVPLGKALTEQRKMLHELRFGVFRTLLGFVVTIVLRVPQTLKVRYNFWMARRQTTQP